MTFRKSTLLVGVVLAFPLSLLLNSPGPESDATADRVASPFVSLGQDDVYARHCAACHGKSGKGDGVAAAAFNPSPVDFTDREIMGELTDDQLRDVIANGNGGMPAFGSVLSAEELDEVLSYIRSLIPDEGAG